MKHLISNKMKDLEGSSIRAVLKLTQRKDIITFAGGSPAPETFPTKLVSKICEDVLRDDPVLALQYGVTDGYSVLLDQIKERMKQIGIGEEFDQFVITSGGQQVIDLACRTILNEGDTVICEAPTFVGGLNAFKSYNANPVGVELENDGINIDKVEAILKSGQKVKMVYVIPTFQNPSGITMSLEKRKRLLALSEQYDFVILEDNPYGELRFSGEDLPTIKSMDKLGRVIYAGSFSKILSPGVRVGWGVAHYDLLDKMVVAKQVVDVHTTMLTQIIASEFLKRLPLEEHLNGIRELYGRKCKFMLDCIDTYFPETVTHTNPQGGLFVWCRLGNDVDTIELMKKATEKKVAFIPGYTFMVDTKKSYNTFRLNYSTPREEQIEEGIKILGDVIKDYK